MSPRRLGKGSQKKARFERLKEEIMRFVTANPGCSAQSIVANLSHDRTMRNHGLTPRKVGLFIPRHLGDRLTWWQDHRAGRRVYGCVETVSKFELCGCDDQFARRLFSSRASFR
ncbi:MAG: hypothetical protein MKZ55_08220, partial [Candidatus Thalassarchaeum sp.]|nr:hypothetical protein [Candidatus Thalassarchaeum sp.]